MSRRAVAPLALLLVASGCAAGEKLRQDAQVIRTGAEQARSSGALRCAPRELALADAHVDVAETELAKGNGGRAREHLRVAELELKRAQELSSACRPVQVTVRKPGPVLIEKTDRDGDGVPDLEDRCPDTPGRPELHGCPDTDGDGIPDPDDACPDEPGPAENRGCPDRDADGDGVPDRLDRCPDVRGVPPDGCPRTYTLVEVKRERIEIKQQVHFATAKSTVLPDSFPLLDQVTQVLGDYPGMRLAIEGHTDAVGGEAANRKLSQRRADAVRDYLVAKGVAASRLETAGFGPTRPVASNGTARGRALNRRTEFRIVAWE